MWTLFFFTMPPALSRVKTLPTRPQKGRPPGGAKLPPKPQGYSPSRTPNGKALGPKRPSHTGPKGPPKGPNPTDQGHDDPSPHSKQRDARQDTAHLLGN